MAVAGSDIEGAQSSQHATLFREESFALSFEPQQSIDDSGCPKMSELVAQMPVLPSEMVDTTADNDQTLQDQENYNLEEMQASEQLCDNRNFLDDIDHHVHYQLDVEIEQFRSNLHSILSQHQERNRQKSPLQRVPQFFESQEQNSSADCHQSSSSVTDLITIDDSPSVPDFEDQAGNAAVDFQERERQADNEINRLVIELHTSLSILTNHLTKAEYAT